jgi:antitoxin component YwqK of YwqJK toxin-antitoxin module
LSSPINKKTPRLVVQPILPVLRPDRLEDYFTRTFFTLVIIGAPLNMKRNLDSSQFNFKYNASMNKNKNGLHTERLVNGMKLEVNYKDGMKHGKETYWYSNVLKASEGVYEVDRLEGTLTYWYENGNKASEGFYKGDKLEGMLSAWNEEGQLESEQEYKNGVLDGTSVFYEDGVKTAEHVLENGEVVGSMNG